MSFRYKMELNELKKLLDGLDRTHAEMVHSYLRFDLINSSLSLLIGKERVTSYGRLCDRFFKDEDVSVLPKMNDVCCKIMDAIEEERKKGTVTEHFVVESVNKMRKLAGKPVRAFDASLKQEMKEVCQKARLSNDIGTTFQALAPILTRIVEQIEQGHIEESIGNMFALFSCLADIKSGHETWFEHIIHGGEMTDLEFLTDAAVEVYCHLRQRKELPKELGEDMDSHLLLFNERTGFFGDWTLSIYADMLYTAEYQSEDYSELENCAVWMEFVECIQEVA